MQTVLLVLTVVPLLLSPVSESGVVSSPEPELRIEEPREPLEELPLPERPLPPDKPEPTLRRPGEPEETAPPDRGPSGKSSPSRVPEEENEIFEFSPGSPRTGRVEAESRDEAALEPPEERRPARESGKRVAAFWVILPERT